MGYLQSRNVFYDYAKDLDPILIEINKEFMNVKDMLTLGVVKAYHILFKITIRKEIVKMRRNNIRKETV